MPACRHPGTERSGKRGSKISQPTLTSCRRYGTHSRQLPGRGVARRFVVQPCVRPALGRTRQGQHRRPHRHRRLPCGCGRAAVAFAVLPGRECARLKFLAQTVVNACLVWGSYRLFRWGRPRLEIVISNRPGPDELTGPLSGRVSSPCSRATSRFAQQR